MARRGPLMVALVVALVLSLLAGFLLAYSVPSLAGTSGVPVVGSVAIGHLPPGTDVSLSLGFGEGSESTAANGEGFEVRGHGSVSKRGLRETQSNRTPVSDAAAIVLDVRVERSSSDLVFIFCHLLLTLGTSKVTFATFSSKAQNCPRCETLAGIAKAPVNELQYPLNPDIDITSVDTFEIPLNSPTIKLICGTSCVSSHKIHASVLASCVERSDRLGAVGGVVIVVISIYP